MFRTLSGMSSGRKKSPARSAAEKLFTYGVLSKTAVIEKDRRWYVYSLSPGAREWLLTMERTEGVVRHPLYRGEEDPPVFLSPEEITPGELMKTLSEAQAAISIRASYRELDVSFQMLGGYDTLVVRQRQEGGERSLLIHHAFPTDEGVDDTPFFESLFLIAHNLCKEYQALRPFEVDEQPYCEVIKLFAELRRAQIREKKMSDPDRIIRRPATNWF